MADHYLDATGGDDSNPTPNEGTPWKTLAKVNSHPLVAGDRVFLKRGEVFRGVLNPASVSGASSAPVIFGAYGTGAKPRLINSIDGVNDVVWTDQGSNIWRAALGSAIGTKAVGQLIFNSETAAGYRKSSSGACTSQGHYYWDNTNKYLYLYSTSNPASYYSTMEISTGGTANGQYNRMQASASYMWWQDLDFRYCGVHGIHSNSGTGKKILRCDISWCGGVADGTYRDYNGIFLWPDGGVITDFEIAYCTLHDCWEKSISLQTMATGLVYNGVRVHHNLMYSTCGGGLELWIGNSAGQVTGIDWINNTIYDNCGSILYAQRAENPTSQFEALRSSVYAGGLVSNSRCLNNIVHTSPPRFTYVRNSDSRVGWTWDYNCYYPMTDATDFCYADDYGDFAEWKLDTGFDAHSITDDPTFTGGGDFTLQGGSPCLSAGTYISGINTTSPPNMGAYEEDSTPPPPPPPPPPGPSAAPRCFYQAQGSMRSRVVRWEQPLDPVNGGRTKVIMNVYEPSR